MQGVKGSIDRKSSSDLVGVSFDVQYIIGHAHEILVLITYVQKFTFNVNGDVSVGLEVYIFNLSIPLLSFVCMQEPKALARLCTCACLSRTSLLADAIQVPKSHVHLLSWLYPNIMVTIVLGLRISV